MPVFSPRDSPPPLRTLCGKDRSAAGHGNSGHRWTYRNIGEHETRCAECIEIQRAIREFADAVVIVGPDRKVLLISRAVKAVRDQFHLTTTRAQWEVGAALGRKLRRLDSPAEKGVR